MQIIRDLLQDSVTDFKHCLGGKVGTKLPQPRNGGDALFFSGPSFVKISETRHQRINIYKKTLLDYPKELCEQNIFVRVCFN